MVRQEKRGRKLGNTGAKPEIGENEQDVATKLAAFQKAVHAFKTNTRGNNVVAMKAQLRQPVWHLQGMPRQVSVRMHHH